MNVFCGQDCNFEKDGECTKESIVIDKYGCKCFVDSICIHSDGKRDYAELNNLTNTEDKNTLKF